MRITKWGFLQLIEKEIKKWYIIKWGFILGIVGCSILIVLFIEGIIYSNIDSGDLFWSITSIILLPFYILFFYKIHKKEKQYTWLFDYINNFTLDEDFY